MRILPEDRRLRGLELLVPVLVLVLPLLSLAPAVLAPGPPTGVRSAVVIPTELEAPDFASEAYGDPWDYSNSEDQNTDASDGTNISVSNGSLQFDATGGTYFSAVSSQPGALPYGRDGAAIPINTSRYKHLSFRMNQSSNGVGAVYWFTCRNLIASCAGGITFPVTAGDKVYDLALDGPSTIGVNLPWSGLMVGLQVRPTISFPLNQREHVSVDWMRLYAPTAGSPHAANPPGDYGTYVIDPLPRPVVDSPDPSEGVDLATAQRGSPWDFTVAANAYGTQLVNARLQGFTSNGMTATNAPPNQADPQVQLGVQPFSADTFHHLSFDLAYDGPFGLYDGAGGGKLARLIWGDAGSGTPQESDDIVTYSGINSHPISIDLTAQPVLDPNSRAPQLGWAGNTVTSIRFDPNEDSGTNTWHLRSVSLRADPTAAGVTTIRFHDAAWVTGTTAEVRVGTTAPGTTYTSLGSGIAVHSGENSFDFSLGALPVGSYRVQLILHHPSGGGAQAFSTTVVQMTRDTRNDPLGSFDGIVRRPGGAVATGWSFDPDSSSPIAVHLYSDGAFAAAVTTSSARPDVAAAYAGAGPSTGFSQSLFLSPGVHSICAYAINIGAGAGDLLGCRQVTISGAPVGDLDSLVPVPGGLRASGWALDPDTTASIQAHVYVGATGHPMEASQNRPDVGAAWSGYGDAHGFSTDFPLADGSYTACGYAIGSDGGGNSAVGCRSVVVGGVPIGSLDEVTRVDGGVRIRGWALDRNTAGPVQLNYYANGVGVVIAPAAASRADIGSIFPAYGNLHGFDVTIPLPLNQTICVYAIDSGGTGNPTIGCQTV